MYLFFFCDLFNINDFIDINNLKEVTSPVLFERGGTPNPDGLISNEIFGVSVKSRKETFAYISLNGHFFNPHIYKVFKRLYRNIEKIISGEMYVSIQKDGTIVQDDDNGNTGIKFIYDNWDKIKWERTQGMRNERVDLITKTPKNEIFMEYQIVIPAFYRDITSSNGGGGSTSELNNLYTRLIRMCSLLKSSDMFDFSFNNTNLSIQNTIVEIYNYFENKLTGKNGLLRKYLLGKNTIYGVRSVISSPSFHYSNPDDMFIDFEHTGIPISQCCVLVNPFIIYWLKTFFEREFIDNQYNKPVYDPKTGMVEKYLKLKNPEAHFNHKFIEKAVERFIRDPESRFDKIEIPTEDTSRKYYMGFTGRYYTGTNPDEEDKSTIINRPLTWTDLLYMAAVDATADKHVLITRYPLLDYFGVFINKVRVSSTLQTEPVIVNGRVYKWYPKIDINMSKDKVSTYFNDTIQFSNSYLPGLDGDYKLKL